MTDALVCLHDAAGSAPGGAPQRHPAVERLVGLVEREPERLRAAGIRAWVAPGVPPGYAATAGAAAALDLLPELLDRKGAGTGAGAGTSAGGGATARPGTVASEGVVAVGGIGPGEGTPLELRALSVQLGLAAQRGLPAIVCLPRRGKPAAVRRVVDMARTSGLAPERLCFAHVNLAALREARRFGSAGVVGVHPAELDPERAARLVARHGAEGVSFGSMLGVGPGDVLALPRIGRAMEKEGVSAEEAGRALWGNAVRFLGTP